MSLTIDTAYAHGRVVGKMVNYGFGMPTRLGCGWGCGSLVRAIGCPLRLAPRRWSCWAVTSIRAMSLSRRHLVRSLAPCSSACSFRCGSVEGDGGDELVDEAVALATDEGVDFVLAIGDADAAGFARELARRMAALDAGEDGFVPYGCIVSEGKVPAVVGTGEVPVFAIIAPELLEGIGSPLRELLGSVCAVA